MDIIKFFVGPLRFWRISRLDNVLVGYSCNETQGQPWLSQRTLDVLVFELGTLDVLVIFGIVCYLFEGCSSIE